MNRRIVLATIVALLATPAVALLAMPAVALAARGPAVTVRVEGLQRTLLPATSVHARSGWIMRFGAPSGACPATSAQGALNVATHRRWHGAWSTEFGPEYEITSILGEKHGFSSRDFWEIFIDNVSASVGACELKLHRGEQLVFAAVPQTGNVYPMAIRAPHTVAPGQSFSVKAVWFDAQGKRHALSGARVSGGGMTAITNGSGIATLTAPATAGALVLDAHHAWSASTAYVRAAQVTVDVS